MNEIYFFDSYAIIEILKGNPRYAPFITSHIITTKLNIFEVYYSVLRDMGEKLANEFLKKFYDFAIEFGSQTIEQAAKFRLLHKKQNISMVDAVGYILARSLGIRFLTGDKQFERLDNVEFVK